jgi:hypothetical protein
MMMLKIIPFAFFSCLCLSNIASVKAQNYTPAVIGFYNVENLFDTLDTPNVNDSEYTPHSAKKWNTERYNEKLTNLARVIGEIGTDLHPNGMIAVGLSEVENRDVVVDLVNTPPLKDRKYDIVHYDSPDRRGIDVALIYQPEFYKVYNHKSYVFKIEGKDDFFSRDQLVVSGVIDTDTVHILVSHWPSRRGGEKKSSPLRVAAANLGRSIIDSLFAINPNARIMYMGDLNDDPVNFSVKRHLRTESKPENARDGRLYNPMEDLYNKGIGTLAWRDTWNLFDQIIISEALATGKDGGYRYFGAKVHNKPYLKQQDGNFAGYPYRTYVGDTYRPGFSDHFPVYLILVKEVD